MLQDRLVAHRGFPRVYPENTLLGFKKAVEAGAHLLETDIQFTADLKPVLYHDALMSRISGIDNAIHLLDFEEAVAHPATEPGRLAGAFPDETICSLAQLVEYLHGQPAVSVFVEVKRTAVHLAGVERAYDILDNVLAPIRERAILISFDEEFMAHAADRGYPRLGLVVKDWQDGEPLLAGQPPEFIFCDIDKIPEGADLAGFAGKLVVYEVDDPDLAANLFSRGADMIETFDIAGMLNALARHAL